MGNFLSRITKLDNAVYVSMCLSLCVVCAPVYAEHDQHVGGEDEAAGPHHHQNLAHEVAGVPLNTQHHRSYYIEAVLFWDRY